MTLVSLNNKQIKELVEEVYSDNLKTFKDMAEKIESVIREQMYGILKKDNTYKLKHDIGVSGGYYFKISSRVKTSTSLGEKLVRKSDLLKLKNLLKEKELQNKDEIANEINIYLEKRYGDLIGIKILGDLNQDETNIYQLLKDNRNEFKSAQYEIIFKNIDDNHPELMQNGLEIYKIDCEYITKGIGGGSKYKFELQIKSQLMSAWADMEHQHYYKNHLFNPVKFTNQPVMNEVGKLLKQTESILIKIRNSEDDYNDVKDRLAFTEEICNTFGGYIERILEINPEPMLSNVAQTLFVLFRVIEPKRELVETVISQDFQGIQCHNTKYKSYRNLVESDFNLQILESIVYVWYQTKGGFNGECFTVKLHNDLKDAIIKEVQIEVNTQEFSNLLEQFYLNFNDNKAYLNLSVFVCVGKLFKYLSDELNNSQLVDKAQLDALLLSEEEDFIDDENVIHPDIMKLCLIYAEILYSDINKLESKVISEKYRLEKDNEKIETVINSYYKIYYPKLREELNKFLEVIKGNEEV